MLCFPDPGITSEGVGVRIAAPPVDGQANTELTRYLATVLGLSKSKVYLDKVKNYFSSSFSSSFFFLKILPCFFLFFIFMSLEQSYDVHAAKSL